MTDRCAAVEPLHSAWLDGVLGPTEAERVAAHLERCRACRAEVDALDRTRRLLGNLPVRRVPTAVLAGPRPAVDVPGRRRMGTAAGLATVIAVLAGVVAGAAYAVGGETGGPAPTVPVPVDVFVADHLVRTYGDHVASPFFVAGP